MAPQMLKMGGPVVQVRARAACVFEKQRRPTIRPGGTLPLASLGPWRWVPQPNPKLTPISDPPPPQARNFAVMTGLNGGVAAFMKRWRGKEDVNNQLVGAPHEGCCCSRRADPCCPCCCLCSSLLLPGATPGRRPAAALTAARPRPACPCPAAAAFCSGAGFSLVSGGISGAPAAPGAPAPNPLMAAFSAGVVFALFQGGFYKVWAVASVDECWSGFMRVGWYGWSGFPALRCSARGCLHSHACMAAPAPDPCTRPRLLCCAAAGRDVERSQGGGHRVCAGQGHAGLSGPVGECWWEAQACPHQGCLGVR